LQAGTSDDEISDVRLALARPPVTVDDASLARSAVVMLLSPGRRVWFIRRAERFGDPWSGHVGFPGGREQPGDHDLHACAVRETWEELSIDLRAAELLGRLDDLRVRPVRTLMVRPFVYWLDHAPVFHPNHEVQAVHHLDLDALLAGTGRGTMRWPAYVGLSLPCVDFDGVRLWGLTLQMVDDLLHRLDGRGTGLERTADGR
jgi:8-oxo-dGTP pyrophosphatase MutT (NUDIX family)